MRSRSHRPARDVGADAIVADEGDVAAGLTAGRRLAQVVDDRREAQGGAAGHARRRAARRAAPRTSRARSPAYGGRSASISSSRSSTAIVCPWTSRWWLGFCSTPRSPSSSGRTRGGGADLVEQLQAANGCRAAEEQPQLGQLALARRLARPCSRVTRKLGGARVELQRERRSDARRADQAQRVVLRTSAARRPAAPAPRGRRAHRSDRSPTRRDPSAAAPWH